MKTQTKEQALESVKNGNISDYTKIYLFALEWVKNQFKWFSSDALRCCTIYANT